MRAAVVLEPGTVPVCTDFPDPHPDGRGDEMELVAAGVHWHAKALSSGAHYASRETFPQVPGSDAVARTSDGRLVYTGWVPEPWGTMADRMVGPVGFELPAGTDPLTVAAGMDPALSGYLALQLHAEDAGVPETVLVLGATGMAGIAAVRSALELGARRWSRPDGDPRVRRRWPSSAPSRSTWPATPSRRWSPVSPGTPRRWCSTSSGGRSPKRPSPNWPAGGPVTTTGGSSTPRSALWAGTPRPCPAVCCAAGGSGWSATTWGRCPGSDSSPRCPRCWPGWPTDD